MQFHPDKCLVMNISKKRHPSKFTYSLHNTDLKTTDTAKYLGIIISHDMKWTKHITQTCSRANRALGFIKRNVKIRSPRIKEKLYNSLVRPHVEYASAVWSPHEVKPIHQLEMVQRRAARWTLNRHHNTRDVGRPPMADVGTAPHRLQTGPSIPNYTWPSPNSTHQLSPTLTKHHISQKSQLYISTMLDKNKLF